MLTGQHPGAHAEDERSRNVMGCAIRPQPVDHSVPRPARPEAVEHSAEPAPWLAQSAQFEQLGEREHRERPVVVGAA